MKTQQCFVLLGSLSTLILGCGLVIVAESLIDADVVLRHTEPGFARTVFWLGIGACVAGSVGTLGACLSSRPALCLYGVSAFAIAVIGVIVGGLLLAVANMHAEEIPRSCTLPASAIERKNAKSQQYQRSYDSMEQALRNCRRNGRPSALGLQDCGQLGKDDAGRWFEEDPHLELVAWLEQQGGCSGFCQGDLPLFAFPAQSGGALVDQSSKRHPRDPCINQFANQLRARGSLAGGIVFLLSAPLLFGVCGASWIVCYPPPRRRKGYVEPRSDDEGLESNRLLDDSDGDDRGAASDSS